MSRKLVATAFVLNCVGCAPRIPVTASIENAATAKPAAVESAFCPGSEDEDQVAQARAGGLEMHDRGAEPRRKLRYAFAQGGPPTSITLDLTAEENTKDEVHVQFIFDVDVVGCDRGGSTALAITARDFQDLSRPDASSPRDLGGGMIVTGRSYPLRSGKIRDIIGRTAKLLVFPTRGAYFETSFGPDGSFDCESRSACEPITAIIMVFGHAFPALPREPVGVGARFSAYLPTWGMWWRGIEPRRGEFRLTESRSDGVVQLEEETERVAPDQRDENGVVGMKGMRFDTRSHYKVSLRSLTLDVTFHEVSVNPNVDSSAEAQSSTLVSGPRRTP